MNAELNRLSTAWFDLKTAAAGGPFSNATTAIIKQLTANMEDLASVIRNGSAPAATYLAKSWTLAELAIRDATVTVGFAVDQFANAYQALNGMDFGRVFNDLGKFALNPFPWAKKAALDDMNATLAKGVHNAGKIL